MIPFFFWDLTEKKQLDIAQDLKKRALVADRKNYEEIYGFSPISAA